MVNFRQTLLGATVDVESLWVGGGELDFEVIFVSNPATVDVENVLMLSLGCDNFNPPCLLLFRFYKCLLAIINKRTRGLY